MHRLPKQTLLVLSATLIGCAPRAVNFVPTENVDAEGLGGQPAALYEIEDSGRRVGRVKVWAEAMRRQQGATFAHLDLEVQNASDKPIRLDVSGLALEAFDQSDRPFQGIQLTDIHTTGADDLVVAPHQAGTFDLFFNADGIAPGNVGSMRLRWVLTYDDGRAYVQFTDFRRSVAPRYGSYYGYYPTYGYYYNPWYGGYWGGYYYPIGRTRVIDRGMGRRHIGYGGRGAPHFRGGRHFGGHGRHGGRR